MAFDPVIYLQGLSTGAGLIIAIGAQNAFVLTQSIRGNHALAVSGLCALIDALLILAGVSGVGTLVASNHSLRLAAALGGATFLLWFGGKALFAAFCPQHLGSQGENVQGLAPTLAATAAVSLLNPHVYLDTVIMLGAISGNHPGAGRYIFGLGAATASILWFFSLAFAGRALAPIFRKPEAWRILNLAVCAMVWWVAAGLVTGIL